MSKVRGKYKQYLYDNDKVIPRTTKWYAKYNSSLINNESIVFDKNHHSSSSTQKSSHEILMNSTSENNTRLLDEEIEEENNEDKSDEDISDEENEDDQHIDENETELNDLNNIIKNEKISKEDLAAAFLASFYNGGITQKDLSDFLQLSNIYSETKLPASFSGLIKILESVDNNESLNSTKFWYCGTCFKKIEKLNNRFQRTCEFCKTSKYVFFFKLIYLLIHYSFIFFHY